MTTAGVGSESASSHATGEITPKNRQTITVRLSLTRDLHLSLVSTAQSARCLTSEVAGSTPAAPTDRR